MNNSTPSPRLETPSSTISPLTLPADEISQTMGDFGRATQKVVAALWASVTALSQRGQATHDALEELYRGLTNHEQIGKNLAKLFHQLLEGQRAERTSSEQVRLQLGALDRKMEQLTCDLIDRQITDPLFRKFLQLYEQLYSLAVSNAGTLLASALGELANDIERFLDNYSLRVSHPNLGDSFDPRLHRPLAQRPTTEAGQHKSIADVFHVGLLTDTRVLQPAQVEVFVCNSSGTQTSTI